MAYGPDLKRAATNLSEWAVFDVGPARVMPADLSVLAHPEAALAASKEGVDLVLSPAESLSDDDVRLVNLRPVEQMATAACGRDRAILALVPRGHGPWRGERAGSGQTLTYVVDTKVTRDKRFQDRVDFEALFSPPILGVLGPFGHK